METIVTTVILPLLQTIGLVSLIAFIAILIIGITKPFEEKNDG